MSAEKISNAMSELSSQYIDEAIRYSPAKRAKTLSPRWIKRGAIAACFCAALALWARFGPSVPDVVTAPGFLAITAYAASSGDALIMQEGIELSTDYYWSLAMSSRPGLPLNLSAAGYHDPVFEVSVDGGTLLLWEGSKITYLGSSFDAKNDTTVYWTSLSQTGGAEFDPYTGSKAHISIVIREEGHIIGYAIVEIYTDGPDSNPARTYYAKLLKSASFPTANGRYQKITPEFVASEIEQFLNTVP